MTERRFPVGLGAERRLTIKWSTAEIAYEGYRERYPASARDQCLQTIAERGGFSVVEMDCFVPNWREMEERAR